jgi:hypothetical protein
MWKLHCKREKTADKIRRDLTRFSYSANWGWSYRYDEFGKPTEAYLRELAGTPTSWDHLRSLVNMITEWR